MVPVMVPIVVCTSKDPANEASKRKRCSIYEEAYQVGLGWATLPLRDNIRMMNFAHAPAAASIFLTMCSAATVVYVGNSDSNEIHVMSLNRATGELTLIERTEIPGIVKVGGSTPLAISPDKSFLFAATRGEPQAVSTYVIDQQSGKLKYIGRGPLVDSMPSISTDKTSSMKDLRQHAMNSSLFLGVNLKVLF